MGARGALARAVHQLRARATESASAGLGTCLCHPNTVRDFLPSFDILAHDCYPIGNTKGPNSELRRVTRQMRETEAGLAAMRPLWFIPQTFDWRWHRSKKLWPKCDQQYLRMPTRDEMANMTWQGIACGANGIVSFCYFSIRKKMKGEEFEKAWGETCADSPWLSAFDL